MTVDSSQRGFCVSLEGIFSRMLLTGIYCRFVYPLGPCLRYMDTVLLCASSIPLILGFDANATSRMWFSKLSRTSYGSESHTRGQLMNESMIANGVSVVNEPSELFTFCGPKGSSDIDVTAVNGPAMKAYIFRWGL